MLKWACLALCSIVVGGCGLSIFYHVDCLLGTRGLRCTVLGGRVIITLGPQVPEVRWLIRRQPTPQHRVPLFPRHTRFSAVEGPVQMFFVPLLPLTVVLGMTAALLWWLDRRPPPGHCQSCGYDLTGNTSGVCPECGTDVPP